MSTTNKKEGNVAGRVPPRTTPVSWPPKWMAVQSSGDRRTAPADGHAEHFAADAIEPAAADADKAAKFILAMALTNVYDSIMPARQPFSDQLRRAIQRSGKSRYAISKETGIAQSILSRFVHGDAGLSLENIDRVCQSIGARLATGKATPRKKGK